MNISHNSRLPLAAAVAAVLTLALPARATDTPSFLVVGTIYRLTVTGPGSEAIPGTVVKVSEIGASGWVKAEYFDVMRRERKALLVSRGTTWINFAHVISATPEPPMDVESPNAR
jgi:hypothetical protein